MKKFNLWLAEKITNGVATMWCAYLFAAIALISLPKALQSGDSIVIVSWVAQTFLQLVLLSIIMVGQKVQSSSVENKIKWAQGGFIGVPGNKTNQHIEIIKALWSQKWNTWYYTGLNKEDQVLFFAYKGGLTIGDCVTIEGKVKSHRDNSTQLSHVKVIK